MGRMFSHERPSLGQSRIGNLAASAAAEIRGGKDWGNIKLAFDRKGILDGQYNIDPDCFWCFVCHRAGRSGSAPPHTG
jgi:hypothetical protein